MAALILDGKALAKTTEEEHIELILVDDVSTDNSLQICMQYAKQDYRVKVIHKENGGLVSARKAGAIVARGEYIANVDADDYISKTYYD